jgi:1-acyl-sn-glycerol-3-phosphate acyltransferase
LNLWAFARHAFGLTAAVLGAGGDALLRSLAGKRSHAERAQWLHRWCAFLLRRLSIELRVSGDVPDRGLIVSNHLSYLDILVFAALEPCAFVAKKEVRRWPIFGFFASIGGTIFVDRTRPHLAQRSVQEMRETLEAGVRVVLFPEGTSTGGDKVLPFKPALFESAIETQQPITAAHLSYQLDKEDPALIACYWGDMTFAPHLLRLLAEQRVVASVRFNASAEFFADRKTAAENLYREVTELAISERLDA